MQLSHGRARFAGISKMRAERTVHSSRFRTGSARRDLRKEADGCVPDVLRVTLCLSNESRARAARDDAGSNHGSIPAEADERARRNPFLKIAPIAMPKDAANLIKSFNISLFVFCQTTDANAFR
jgi:hypothetical protein